MVATHADRTRAQTEESNVDVLVTMDELRVMVRTIDRRIGASFNLRSSRPQHPG